MMQTMDILPSSQILAAQHARHAAQFELMENDNVLLKSYTVKTGEHSHDAVFEYADGSVKRFDGKNWSASSK